MDLNDLNEIPIDGDTGLSAIKGSDSKLTRRPYSRPRVLSAESLEAVAATCDPPAPPYGKTIPTPCLTLGS